MPGLLALVGGDEFKPGNEEQDRLMVAAAGAGVAYVVPTAAARQGPDRAVAHATDWFARLGLTLRELPVLKRSDAMRASLADEVSRGGFFYLVGGDPGLVAQVLRGSVVWRAMFGAWRAGAVLAGSSAGAMALCSHTLVRATWPNRFQRRPMEALAAVPRTAVLPHYETFGHRWVDSAREAAPDLTLLGIDERSAAVWQDGRWRAAGPGAVTVVRGAKTTRFESGAEVKGLRQPARMLPKR
ncbi:MAG TPA: Type 1 glutamine amidotransferase-like domain-containing protein [Candidatus Dormibacteraeota bacterium]|nr:Type 1 glutamine amidotransferase-like domain-containing protein [Candidatus Dormibacteraeota bacterium]